MPRIKENFHWATVLHLSRKPVTLILSIVTCFAFLVFCSVTPNVFSVTFQELSSSPCILVLHPVKSIPNAQAVALWTMVNRPYDMQPKLPNPPLRSRIALGIYADWLPSPSSYGDFDRYEGFAQVPGRISWQFKMVQVKGNESWFGGETWVGKFDEISWRDFPLETLVQVRHSNSRTNKLGPAVMENIMDHCQKPMHR